jgi:tetratricopeptide (TPR) repeat protein
MWPLILALLLGALATAPAGTPSYVVDGLTLGENIPLTGSTYRSYACKPSEAFEGYTWCQRVKPRDTFAGRGLLSTTIMHAPDGTAIYLMANIAPVSIDRNTVQKEIEELAKEIGGPPSKVEWATPRSRGPTSVIAVWGQLGVQQLTADQVATVAAGRILERSVLVDRLGDLVRSARSGFPIYRLSGGAGYLYSASFDDSGRGHRHYLAADISALTVKQADSQWPDIKKLQAALQKLLQEDRHRAKDDYGLWPKVALLARNLSLQTSPDAANQMLDQVFDKYRSTKLRSHVWPLLPLGSIQRLARNTYWADDIYGQDTHFPEVRARIQRFLTVNPTEPFSEFLYYTIGDLDRAANVNPNSAMASVLRYARGHQMFGRLLHDVAAAVGMPEIPDSTDRLLSTLNYKRELYGEKFLGIFVPNFAERAAEIQPYFTSVERDASSPHRDDAAYTLGWLALHQGKLREAMEYMSQAMTLGNRDYESSALSQTRRILQRFPAREQMAIVQSNPVFAHYATLWYFAARSAYRDFDYALAIECGERALRTLNVPIDRLPATTDPTRIHGVLEKFRPNNASIRRDRVGADRPDADDVLYDGLYNQIGDYGEDSFDEFGLGAIVYLVEASREMLWYVTSLQSIAADGPNKVGKRARDIIVKYSVLVDKSEHNPRGQNSAEPSHRDLRQATHLIDVTLGSAPMRPQYAQLREWLYYRKVRILAQFDPRAVPEAIAAMEREFPRSELMDDALAEQVFAEGIMMEDVDAAQRTFTKLIDNFPGRNAIDNAHTWMAIIFRCAGQVREAQRMNEQIIKSFPLTRHSAYALQRMSEPTARNGCRRK